MNSLKDLLAYFNDLWDKNWTDDIKVVKEGFTKENYRKTGEKCITDYYNHYQPFNERVIGIETQDVISLDKEGKYKWHARMDRLDDKGNGHYEIHDYKTGGYLPKQSDLDEDRQLALYSLWVKHNLKDAKRVELVWHYLAYDKELRSERTAKQLEALRKETLEAVKKVEAAKEFPAIVSNLCDWCDYKSRCPKWSHKFKVEALKPKEFKKEDGVKLVDSLSELSLKKKELETKIEAIKEDIIAYSKKLGVEVVFGSDKKATISISKDISFPAKHSKEREELVKLLKKEKLWGEVSDLDLSALKRIVKDKEWDDKTLKKLEKYEEERESEGIRLSKIDGDD
jgi:putative RecB family exonuclease